MRRGGHRAKLSFSTWIGSSHSTGGKQWRATNPVTLASPYRIASDASVYSWISLCKTMIEAYVS